MRKSGNRRNSKPIDVETVREWLNIPTQSNRVLGELATSFRKHHATTHSTHTGCGPGVQALIALAESKTDDEFRTALDQIRSGVPSAPGGRHSIKDLVSQDNFDEAVRLFAQMRAHGEQLSEVLSAAKERTHSGGAVDLSEAVSLVDEWNVARVDAFAALTADTPDSDDGFEVLDILFERAESARESAAQEQLQRELDRQAKRDELDKFEQSLIGLGPLKDSSSVMATAYEEAIARIAELKEQLTALESRAEHGDPVQSVDDAGANECESGQDVVSADHCLVDVEREGYAPEQEPEAGGEFETEAAVDASTASAEAIDVSDTPVLDEVVPTTQAQATDVPEVGSEQVDASDEAAVAAEPEEIVSARGDADASEPNASDSVAGGDQPPLVTDVDVAGEIEAHLAASRYGAAWAVAAAAVRSAADIDAYRLAAAAFHSGPGRLEPVEVLTEFAKMDDRYFSDPDTARVAVAALLRASLTVGWAPTSEMADVISAANLDMPWSQLVVAAQDVRMFVPEHLAVNNEELNLEKVQAEALKRFDALTKKRINFTRADNVRRYLLRSGEVLGRAFTIVADTPGGDQGRKDLAAIAAELANPNRIIAAADEEVSSRQQLKEAIIGNARNSLDEMISEVAELVDRALTASVKVTGQSGNSGSDKQNDLLAAARMALSKGSNGGPGAAALRQLAAWILSADVHSRALRTVDEVLFIDTLPAVHVLRSSEGVPVFEGLASADRDQVIADLHDFDKLSGEQLVKAYVASGNLMAADAAAASDPDLLATVESARGEWVGKLRRRVSEARGDIIQTFVNDYAQRDQVNAEAKLVGPSKYDQDRYDLELQKLAELQASLKAHRAATASDLRGKIEVLETVSKEDRAFIGDRIAEEDFVGAHELLAQANAGKPLPKLVNSIDGNASRFNRFREIVATLAPADIDGIIDQFENANNRQVSGDHRGELRAWAELGDRSASRSKQTKTMDAVLNTIGLHLKTLGDRQTVAGRNPMYQVHASRHDKSLVPGLGSEAPHYQVAVVNDHATLRQTLMAFRPPMGPNIVLVNGVLSLDERRQCLVVCRREKISAIVVDHAVAAAVVTTSPLSFSATQQLTLPYTCFSHYASASGHVPDEVFVGRRSEQAQLEAMTGSMFVYGGRQLGKSALLRKIQRDFAEVGDQQAIYMDLSLKGLGSWGEPLEFWNGLYSELARIGIVAHDTRVHKPEPVTKAIRKWLKNKTGRRLLLLLDEADKFLEAESAIGFPNISPLKDLFDSTGGRCKPIFAGLHKVQRLQNVANTPLAHGGQDILIGPLTGGAALDLVVGPLQALGYDFEEPTLVWRLLAHTNLQPGLIQIVCIGLIEHLEARALGADEPLVTITAADIDAVTQNPKIRRDIADRLRLTITLEDRFHVIALVVAVMGMETDFRDTYTAAEIREHCELYWEDGFRGLNTAEFDLYLEEMEGLGVLSADGNGKYSMRSPNIVNMLGSKNELETALRENEFQLPNDFNPKSARREVTLASGQSVRSPLTEQQLAELLPNAATHPAKNFVIVGSAALGLHTAIPTLNDVALNRGISLTVIDAASDTVGSELVEFKFAPGGTARPRCLIVDATTTDHSTAARLAATVASMRRRSRGHLIIVVGQTALAAAPKFFDHETVVDTTIVHTSRWTRDGLRSWQDNSFASPSMQCNLLEASRGWPELVASAIDNVTDGQSHSEELARLDQFPADKATAERFLLSVGITEAGTRGLLRTWYEYTDDKYESVPEIAAVLDTDSADMYDLIEEFTARGAVDQVADNYRVDKIVARALTRLATA